MELDGDTLVGSLLSRHRRRKFMREWVVEGSKEEETAGR
jgi:hypothetical protein